MNGKLNEAVEKLLASYAANQNHIDNLDRQPLPSSAAMMRAVETLQELLFPGFFGTQGLTGDSLRLRVIEQMEWLEINLTGQIECALAHGDDNAKTATDIVAEFLLTLPRIRRVLASDVQAAYDGDPIAASKDEVIASYPSVFAVTIYRLAHELYKLKVPLLPRMMSEHAHRLTGIDIHPATRIGAGFFIDHGTGVVIGGTAVIGNRVKIYQGVTLGAFSFPKDKDGNLIRDAKRHPTIEDDVVIYAGATILGGDTVIGKGSAIGGNVWLTKSVPSFSKVSQEQPSLKIITPEMQQNWDYVI